MNSFRIATEEDARYVGLHLRDSDWLEIERTGSADPYGAPLRSIQKSLISWTMADPQGVPIAVWGVSPFTLPGVGVVWLLGTPQLDRSGRYLIRQGAYYVDLMGRLFPEGLVNAVDVENSRTRRWLRALGFTEGETVKASTGHPFIIIHYKRPS